MPGNVKIIWAWFKGHGFWPSALNLVKKSRHSCRLRSRVLVLRLSIKQARLRPGKPVSQIRIWPGLSAPALSQHPCGTSLEDEKAKSGYARRHMELPGRHHRRGQAIFNFFPLVRKGREERVGGEEKLLHFSSLPFRG